MLNSAGATFQQALEIVEGLPDEQQQELVEIVRSRQRERRREALAASIEQARRELARGRRVRRIVGDERNWATHRAHSHVARIDRAIRRQRQNPRLENTWPQWTPNRSWMR